MTSTSGTFLYIFVVNFDITFPRLLDLLFKFFTSWCLRIVPALFLRDMYRALHLPPSHTPLKTTHYSPMLHNALVALAMAFSDDPQIRDLKSRRLFLDQAKSYIDTECQSPNISVVHALSTIGSFHSSMGEQSLGYLYFGEVVSLRSWREALILLLRYEWPHQPSLYVRWIPPSCCHLITMTASGSRHRLLALGPGEVYNSRRHG
jgi:Fungal specific transcription factor domain